MIATLLRISWTNLKRDRVAQAMTFALPILFFSIFATVFGNQGNNNTTSRIRIAVVDEDNSDFSRRTVEGLQKETALRVRTTVGADGTGARLDRSAARAFVKNGDVPVAVILPKGLGSSAAAFGPSSNGERFVAESRDDLGARHPDEERRHTVRALRWRAHARTTRGG
jgi:ABC-2 type transport system permease protein